MFDWVQNSYPARKKAFEILTFLNPLIKFVTSLEGILKCPECHISRKLEHISVFGANLLESIILGEDH